MTELFQRNKSTISRHIRNVFEEGELLTWAEWLCPQTYSYKKLASLGTLHFFAQNCHWRPNLYRYIKCSGIIKYYFFDLKNRKNICKADFFFSKGLN